MAAIHAAILGPDRSASPDGSAIAGYQLEIDDQARGRVEFYAANPPKPSENVAQVIALDDDCIANLLAEAVAKLKSDPDGHDIDEPALVAPTGVYRSAGIVPVNDRGYVTIREPANHYGGYVHSYAKGRIEPGETPQQAAHRELGEETGITGTIVALIGDFKGDVSVTRLYVGIGTGGEPRSGPETWSVNTVSPLKALEMLNKQRDKDALVRLVQLAAGIVDWSWTVHKHPVRCRVLDGRIACSTDAGADGKRPD